MVAMPPRKDNPMTQPELLWSEIFINPDNVTYGLGETGLKQALADGLGGWGCCMATGDRPVPKNFGIGMIKIGDRLGITPLAQNLQEMFDKLYPI